MAGLRVHSANLVALSLIFRAALSFSRTLITVKNMMRAVAAISGTKDIEDMKASFRPGGLTRADFQVF